MSRILVIRLGALGDFVLSFGPFAAIRARHEADEITLLTTRPFAELARRSPWFDRVEIDTRPAFWQLGRVRALRRQLRGFDFVYDLQTSDRSSTYFRLAGSPPWSGIALGCSHPHANPGRNAMHTLERQREQLEMAGIRDFPAPDLTWLKRKLPFAPPEPYALLVPGAAPTRPRKRWPAERYGEVARAMAERGLVAVVAGTAAEAPLAATIRAAAPASCDLTGKTSLVELASLAAGARLALGNDTGPMHLAATMGTPCVVLFSADSDPALACPRAPDGGWAKVLSRPDLANLPVDEVLRVLKILDS